MYKFAQCADSPHSYQWMRSSPVSLASWSVVNDHKQFFLLHWTDGGIPEDRRLRNYIERNHTGIWRVQ